ncbi:MAG: ABC transporter ATP-binding protein, partial [Gemmatimonadota bacterium]|nr:ABC transporter ATP-binding protein [Gemmatimonadota bacterium]
RSIEEISGGEMQRARIARALAQEPQTLVLDEPTASLDLHHEMETFELLLSLAEGSDITVIVVTHNLNLAARYASHMLLLNEGKIVGEGSPTQVLSQKTVEKTFQWPVAVVLRDEAGPNKNSPQVVPLSVSDIEQRKKS